MQASERSNVARQKLTAVIKRGRPHVAQLLEQINTTIPENHVIRPDAIEIIPSNQSLLLRGIDLKGKDFTHTLHRNAMGQMAQKAKIPTAYIDTLKQDGQLDLLADNLNKRIRRTDKKVLTRSVNEEVRGFLSSRYGIFDTAPLLDSFVKGIQKYGAVPYEGYALDTKSSLQVLLPELYEPLAGEVIAFGATFSNSEFGNGAVSITEFILRMWCDNGAIGANALRRVHLGRDLSEGDFGERSERGQRIAQMQLKSDVADISEQILQPKRIEEYVGAVKEASEDKLDAKRAKEMLKKFLLKGEAEAATEAFNSADVEMMPAGNTRYRLSNAVSWLANSEKVTAERKLELQRVAGQLLTGGKASE